MATRDYFVIAENYLAVGAAQREREDLGNREARRLAQHPEAITPVAQKGFEHVQTAPSVETTRPIDGAGREEVDAGRPDRSALVYR
jgi:hypothetical protein